MADEVATLKFCEKCLRFYGKIFKILFREFPSRHRWTLLCSNFVKFGRREIVRYLTKTTKFRVRFLLRNYSWSYKPICPPRISDPATLLFYSTTVHGKAYFKLLTVEHELPPDCLWYVLLSRPRHRNWRNMATADKYLVVLCAISRFMHRPSNICVQKLVNIVIKQRSMTPHLNTGVIERVLS